MNYHVTYDHEECRFCGQAVRWIKVDRGGTFSDHILVDNSGSEECES